MTFPAGPSPSPNEIDFERRLDEVRASAAGYREGVFGPHSLTWRVDREAALFLAAGRALLLQLAHPWVSAAIAQHSQALVDPIGRFHRTFGVVFTIVFGALDDALAAARRLHRRHAAVTGVLPGAAGPFPAGSAYSADNQQALQWVHATLTDSALLAYELLLPPLTAGERQAYYAESRILATLYGIFDNNLPRDWPAFVAYNEAMWDSDILTVSGPARTIAGQILSGTGSWLWPPHSYRALTAALLPQRFRLAFGLAYEAREQRLAQHAIARARRWYLSLPGRLRHVGPYQEAMARVAGQDAPDLMTEWLNKLWIGRSSLAA
jgi:uncharacterized protein (DUF2236 family)